MEALLEFFDTGLFFKFAAALVALINPLYGIPIFLGMTKGYSQAERRRIANIVAITVFVSATIAAVIGEEILSFFGIGVPAFQIGGGIIVLLVGLSMLQDNSSAGDEKAIDDGQQKGSDFAVVPLSIPLTIGPGTFATIILFAHLLSDGGELVTMIPVIFLISVLTWLGLIFADPISRLLGNTSINVVTRIMAIILVAIAVEMVLNGAVSAYHHHFEDAAKAAGSS
ncbi:MAG: MarC family protein [Hyphomicrobiales bacterium]|nr:MarC family protein [Hyphomicrobiales bacterium]MCP4999229.1 MarC family protein [Hyphomicrobiales bacterium]